MKARLITAPRVPRRLSWQRSTSEITGSSDEFLSTAAAVLEALAASSPWPMPSMAAIKTPFLLQHTRWRSPDSPWPGSTCLARPYSTIGSFTVSTFSPIRLSPGRVARRFQNRPSNGERQEVRAPGFQKLKNRRAGLDEYQRYLGLHQRPQPKSRSGWSHGYPSA